VIIRNAVKCNKCQEVLQSTHVHDYVECLCQETMVDGGNEYFRYGGSDVETLFVETHSPYVPHSVQLENSDVVLAAHHPDTCVGSICALHKRTDHVMRGWEQSLEMIGKVFIMTRICTHGIIHTDPDDFFVYDIGYCKDCDPPRKEVIYA
jgi:hypothetical protein